eukprot:GHVT01045919.1.p1 GENE.GHVT01045919.1~~GHVT01045919.1.p1  ORF type:complete len:487 (-),score=96.06 GHVT01045919.1:408-1868(-)
MRTVFDTSHLSGRFSYWAQGSRMGADRPEVEASARPCSSSSFPNDSASEPSWLNGVGSSAAVARFPWQHCALDSAAARVRLGGASSFPRRPLAASAADVLRERRSRQRVYTSICDLDFMLGGGVSADAGVYEVCGLPGSGKTQMCLQLCMNAQIPSWLGGTGGRAIVIDTEGAVTAERLEQLAQGLQAKIARAVRNGAGPASHQQAATETFENYPSLPTHQPNPNLHSAQRTPAEPTELHARPQLGHAQKTDAVPKLETLLRGVQVLRVFDHQELEEILNHIQHKLTSLNHEPENCQASSYKPWQQQQQQHSFDENKVWGMPKISGPSVTGDGLPSNTDASELVEPSIGCGSDSSDDDVDVSELRLLVIDSISLPFRHAFHNEFRIRAAHLIRLGALLTRLGTQQGVAVVVTNHLTTVFKPAIAEVAALGPSWRSVLTTRVLLAQRAYSSERPVHVAQVVMGGLRGLTGKQVAFTIGHDGLHQLQP